MKYICMIWFTLLGVIALNVIIHELFKDMKENFCHVDISIDLQKTFNSYNPFTIVRSYLTREN